MSFEDLGLSPETLRAVQEAGYVNPTPIQEQAIPQVLRGRDILGCAQTGTGKTAAFTLPMIDMLDAGRARARMPRSLILTPTRELATQIAQNFEVYGKFHKLTMALLIGGVSMDDQIRKLDRGVDVLIATPGRLLDHYDRGRVLMSDIKILVIDEADRMMDMGFMPDVERIVSFLPRMRQTLFFSATLAPEIRRLADAFLINPKEITVSPTTTAAETVTQGLAVIPAEDKREALRRLIRAENVRNALVFCNRKKDVDILFKSLKKHGFNAAALHGDMVQSARTETYEAFKRGETTILVCSDVAARGLDIDDLSHVFNFDVPMHSEDYVHRIGRTGRAGRSGRAFTLASPDDGHYVNSIETLMGKPIPRIEIDGIETVAFDEEGGSGRRRRRKRPAAPAEPRRAEAKDGGRRRRRGEPKPDRAAEAVVADDSEAQTDAAIEQAAAPSDEPRPRQDRRRSRGPQTDREPRAAREPRSEREPRQDREPRPNREPRPEREPPPSIAPDSSRLGGRPPRRDRDRDRRHDRDDDERVIGMGSHVPAFLLRPVRLPAEERVVEEETQD
ncbi:MAG: DEAD/DEAH box helicase [Rhodospirillales bacterium]